MHVPPRHTPSSAINPVQCCGPVCVSCCSFGGGQQQLLLLFGRLLIASLSAAVCGSELWRLLGTPLTSFDNGDGHDDLRLRVPQVSRVVY